MSNGFIDIGYNNMVAVNKIISIVLPDGNPIKRLIQGCKENNKIVDVTCGRKTRSVIITNSDYIILSAIQPQTISKKMSDDKNGAYDE